MARFAIGDIQGCYAELRALLQRCGFRSDRDTLWFVGDLVNRGPASLEVLRFVKSLGDNAVTVLGNHDLHLLALAFAGNRAARPDDTLDAVLAARDRESLLEWLLARPLAHQHAGSGDLLIHAGLLPQWSARDALRIAASVAADLRESPRAVFADMYGNRPRLWREDLDAPTRRRAAINVLTRMRYCTPEGHIDVKLKGAPGSAPEPWLPWFAIPGRASRDTRIVFGHWSTLGWYDGDNVLALDTGCVWGGALTAVQLDAATAPDASPEQRLPRFNVACSLPNIPGGETA